MPGPEPLNGFEPMTSNPLSRIMDQALDESVFPGAVLLCARGSTILFHEAFGRAGLEQSPAMGRDFVFDLASLTKPMVTSALINLLIKDNRLDLDTCLGDVVSQTRNSPKASISVNMLLRHTSGLPAYREYYKSMVRSQELSRKALRQLLVKEPLEAAPGKHQVYSDLGYMFLAWVIETLLDQRIDRAARDLVFNPLGIKDLFFVALNQGRGVDQVPVRPSGRELRMVSSQVCPWRKKTMTGEVDDDNAWAAGGIEGHAGLFGDALSIHRFCCEVLDGLLWRSPKVFSSRVLASFTEKKNRQEMVAGFDSPSKQRSSAGRFFSSRSVGHLGFTGTSFWIDPETEFIVILLTNRTLFSRGNEKIKIFRPELHDTAASYFL